MFRYESAESIRLKRGAARLLGAVVALGLAFALTACGGGGDTAEAGASPQPQGTGINADIEDVQIGKLGGDPEAFIGDRVRVKGTVTEVIGLYAFLLGSDKTDVEPLLVVGAEKNVADKGDVVTVTGEVASEFGVPDVEDELGVDLDDPLFEPYVGENYIRATQVVPAE